MIFTIICMFPSCPIPLVEIKYGSHWGIGVCCSIAQNTKLAVITYKAG